MKYRTMWVHAVLVCLFILAIFLEVTEGSLKQDKSRRRIKKSRAGVGKDFSEFLLVIGAIMTCVIAPVFTLFLYSIYKDPAVPELVRACSKAIKGKFFSYLGGPQPAMSGSSFDQGQPSNTSSSRREARRRSSADKSGNNQPARSDNDGTNTSVTFRASRQRTSRSGASPPAIVGDTSDQSYAIGSSGHQQQPTRYAEDDDRTAGGLGHYGYASYGRQSSRTKQQERGDRDFDMASGIASFSSGALLPSWEDWEGAKARDRGSHEIAGDFAAAGRRRRRRRRKRSPMTGRHEGSGRASVGQRAGYNGNGGAYHFESGPRVPWDPYPDGGGGGDDYSECGDRAEEPEGWGGLASKAETEGVYKSTQSKRRMERSRRARGL